MKNKAKNPYVLRFLLMYSSSALKTVQACQISASGVSIGASSKILIFHNFYVIFVLKGTRRWLISASILLRFSGENVSSKTGKNQRVDD